jgi:hypothetical protein
MDRADSELELESMRARMAGMAEMLDGPWAAALRTQLHLDRDSAESAYWHAGYYQALADFVEALSAREPIYGTADTSNRIPVAC